MAKNQLTMAMAFKVGRLIEDNCERLLEIDTAQQRAEFVEAIVGFQVTAANFNAAAEAAKPGVFVGNRNSPRPPKGVLGEIMRELRDVKERLARLEAECGGRELPFP